MQTYDFLMIFVLGGLTIYGYAKGMAWQVAYLTSFIASYFVAVKFSGQLAPVFGDAAPWNKFAAMAAIYVGFSLVIWMIFRGVKGGIDKVRLESFDHQMGAIVGAVRGVVWCVFLTFLAVTLMPDGVKQQVISSQSGRYIARLIDQADAVVPPEVHQVIGPHLDRLENELNQGQGALPAAPQPGGQSFGWPQANTQPPTGPTQSDPNSNWPTLPQPGSGWPNTGANQPSFNQPTGTPAQPASWPNQPIANPWPQQ